MPIPIILGGLAAVAVGSMFKNMSDANTNYDDAKRRNSRAFNQLGQSRRALSEQQELTQSGLIKLANRKRGTINGSLKSFLVIYEKIMKIDFQESKALLDFHCKALTTETLTSMRKMTAVAAMPMSTKEELRVMLFNGWRFGGITSVIAEDSERVAKVAAMRRRQANVISSQIETQIEALQAVHEKTEAMAALLGKLNLLFMKSIRHTADIIETHGSNRADYTVDERKALMNCINFACAVKDVVDTDLFDEDGAISQQVKTAIQTGNTYLLEMEKAVHS